MATLDSFIRSKALNQIPQKKLEIMMSSIENLDIKQKSLLTTAYNRYYESNLPIEYWDLKMESDFVGEKILMEYYLNYVNDLKNNYIKGKSLCFCGPHGVGKTFCSISILKKAIQKGYQCLYTSLSDATNVLIQSSSEEKYAARKELTMVDFLFLDEFDPRFIATNLGADLYARTLETIFRVRAQNKLPTLFATNSPNVLESFNGPLKNSIDSLFKGYVEEVVVFGNDFRKKDK